MSIAKKLTPAQKSKKRISKAKVIAKKKAHNRFTRVVDIDDGFKDKKADKAYNASTLTFNKHLTDRITELTFPGKKFYWRVIRTAKQGEEQLCMQGLSEKSDNYFSHTIGSSGSSAWKPDISVLDIMDLNNNDKFIVTVEERFPGMIELILEPYVSSNGLFEEIAEYTISVSKNRSKAKSFEEMKTLKSMIECSEYKMYRYKADYALLKSENSIGGRNLFETDGKAYHEYVEPHRDHVYSVKDGFEEYIPPFLISHYTNIMIIEGSDNCSKGAASHRTRDEFLQRIVDSGDYTMEKINELIAREKNSRNTP